MANLITLIRLVGVFVIAAIAFYAEAPWQLLNVPLIIIDVLLDGLDGIIARARHEVSVFGAVFDIAADRVIEFVLWITLAGLGMISVWVPIIIITRGVLVDSLRKPYADHGKAPFDIMKTAFGKFLVASRTMRFSFGFLKLLTFSWLFFLVPATTLWPQVVITNYALFDFISNVFVYTTVSICLARGIPVMLETILYKK